MTVSGSSGMRFRRLYNKEGGLGTNRLEALSDGVFGVAITLLILAIAVPELSKTDLADGQLLHMVIALWPKVLVYVMSFLIVGIFWVGHAIMFAYIHRSDRTLLYLNTLLLMTVSFIPFAADLLGRYPREPVALAVYGLTLAFGGVMFEVVWIYASKKHRLIRANMPHDLIHLGKIVILITPVIYTLAAVLAFWNSYLSLGIYVLVPLLYMIPGPIDDLVTAARGE